MFPREGGTIRATPHRVSTLAQCEEPQIITSMRSFIGSYKILAQVIKHAAILLDPLKQSTVGAESGNSMIVWTDKLRTAFKRAQKQLESSAVIKLPRASDQLWLVTDGATSCTGLGATLYCTSGKGKMKLSGFFSAKLRVLQKGWIPCEIEALAITSSIRHFSPYIVQSKHRTTVLSLVYRQKKKLRRGEFSASPRVTTFLETVSRYNVQIGHLKGSTNLVSDFASINAQECNDVSCQICKFLEIEVQATLMAVKSTREILAGDGPLPYTDRKTWREIQRDCHVLRKVFALKKPGNVIKKKITNDRDTKR